MRRLAGAEGSGKVFKLLHASLADELKIMSFFDPGQRTEVSGERLGALRLTPAKAVTSCNLVIGALITIGVRGEGPVR